MIMFNYEFSSALSCYAIAITLYVLQSSNSQQLESPFTAVSVT